MTKETFYKVLDKFQYKYIDNGVYPVLISGTIEELCRFIEDELTPVIVEDLSQEIDPNEGDPGSALDQEADYK